MKTGYFCYPRRLHSRKPGDGSNQSPISPLVSLDRSFVCPDQCSAGMDLTHPVDHLPGRISARSSRTPSTPSAVGPHSVSGKEASHRPLFHRESHCPIGRTYKHPAPRTPLRCCSPSIGKEEMAGKRASMLDDFGRIDETRHYRGEISGFGRKRQTRIIYFSPIGSETKVL